MKTYPTFLKTVFSKALIVSLLSSATICSYAQNSADSIEMRIRPYAGLRGHAAIYDGKMDIQENASRIGTEVAMKKGKLGFVAAAELQVNMLRGGSSFNADGSLSGGFLTIQSGQNQQVFGNRLGYLGVEFERLGRLTFGKQWSVYRDVTAYTDRFNVFGSKGSATFIGGTDGGANGTGRADQSIIYRNQIGRLYIGGQLQARGANNHRFVDGFGASAQMQIIPELRIGAAFNKAFLSDNLINDGKILGLSGQPIYATLGGDFKGKKIDFSAVAVLQKNGDFTQGHYADPLGQYATPTVVFDATGLELFAKYKWNKLSLLAGYNLYIPSFKPNNNHPITDPIDKGFKRNDLILGVSYQPIRFVQFYSEQRISNGRTALGAKEDAVFTIGMKIDLSTQLSKMIAL
ncbi:porin [Sphingobacterium paucimobilis]|uniref:Porin domain-containing protein n=1 Tax=Sphingobacterium paucimobilis HER1398 TaxID=1346330 RepID=U2JE10_9SPHI|nr:porin [Sphingobacterium paucimobilis]ERJ60918.1 hypothetical protein M472_19365 [Sphingobacterium paucimobilis HER1398]